MTTKLKPTKAPRGRDADARTQPLTIKVSENERRLIGIKADRYTGGNVSEFLRYAAFNFGKHKKDAQ